MDNLLELDRDAFLFLNGFHTEWLDQPMFLLSRTLIWIPLYVFLLYIVYTEYRSNSWIVLIGIALTITLSDQITTSLMKPFFERLRPSNDPELQGLVHIINNYRGSRFGFASSHAANTFGTALLLYLLLHQKRRGVFILFFWALFVSYTRIYLGVHYPGDIIGGALVGALCALVMFRLINYTIRQRTQAQIKEGSSVS